MKSWYRIAKIGEQYLKAKGVSDVDIPAFKLYLDSLPDNAAKYLMNNFIIKNPSMSIEDLRGIPVNRNELTSIDPDMEILVKRISEDKVEREWLRKLVLNGRFQKEDSIKLYNLLNRFHMLNDDLKITEFSSDIELSEYIDKKTSSTYSEPQGDYELLENQNINGDVLQLYFITDQESLDSIGGDASWCVLSHNGMVEYEPFEYYCFVINGIAEVLVHNGSNQIKDRSDGELRNGRLVSLIDPFVKKHQILHREEDHQDPSIDRDDYQWEEDNADILAYEETVDTVEKIKEWSLSEDAGERSKIYDVLNDRPSDFALIPEAAWPEYVDYYGDRLLIDDEHKSTFFEEISNSDSRSLEYLATFYKLHGQERDFEKLRDQVSQSTFYDENNLTVGRYHKLVPDILRTEKTNEEFNLSRGAAMDKWRNKLVTAYANLSKCPFKELKEDENLKEEALNFFFENLSKDPRTVNSNYADVTGFTKDLLKRDEEALNEQLKQGWINLFNDHSGKGENSIFEGNSMLAGTKYWSECPKVFREMPEIQAAYANFMMTRWEKYLHYDAPYAYSRLTNLFNDFDELDENITPLLKSKLQSVSYNILSNVEFGQDLFESNSIRPITTMSSKVFSVLNSDSKTQQLMRGFWSKCIQLYGESVVYCPYPDIIESGNMDELSQSVISHLQSERMYKGKEWEKWDNLQDVFKIQPNIRQSFIDYVVSMFSYASKWEHGANGISQFESLSEDIKKDPQVKSAMHKGFKDFLNWLTSPSNLNYNDFPQDLINYMIEDPEINEFYQNRNDPEAEINNVVPDENLFKSLQTNDRLWSSSFNNNYIGALV